MAMSEWGIQITAHTLKIGKWGDSGKCDECASKTPAQWVELNIVGFTKHPPAESQQILAPQCALVYKCPTCETEFWGHCSERGAECYQFSEHWMGPKEGDQ